jgi:hypothetical protein
MKIKNLVCTVSLFCLFFSSHLSANPLEVAQSYDWPHLEDASESWQELWRNALAAMGLDDREIPLKKGIEPAQCLALHEKNLYCGINEELLETIDPALVVFAFYQGAAWIKIDRIGLSVSEDVFELFEKIDAMIGALCAIDALLRLNLEDVVDVWLAQRLHDVCKKNPLSYFWAGAGPSHETLYRYGHAFVKAYNEGIEPDYFEFARKYCDELLTGIKNFRCYFILHPEDKWGNRPIERIDLSDNWSLIHDAEHLVEVIDCSRPVLPGCPPTMTLGEAYAKLGILFQEFIVQEAPLEQEQLPVQ